MQQEQVTVYQNTSYRTFVLIFLTFIYAVNFVDRQLIAILQEAIKADLGLSDTQLGLLSGFAFALFYVLAGVPIARWADRANRRDIISISVALWSFMTAISGAAQNFFQLLLARIGVGVGEAGCSPPAHSMISDMYPAEQRATALSFYSVGINIGIMIGFLLGGYINEYFGWRWAFVVVGAPGILIALIFWLTVKEPIRGFSDKRQVSDESIPLKQVVSFIVERRFLLHVSMGAALSGSVGYALTNWSASFFIRSHQMATTELGVWLAAGVGVFGGIGTFGWGYLCDKYGRHDKRWYMWLPSISILLTIPFIYMVLTVESTSAALWWNLFPAMFTTGYLGSCLAVFHGTVEPRMRATASALFFLILNIIGLGCGPTLVGMLSDSLAVTYGSADALRYALLIVIPVGSVWAAIHFYLAANGWAESQKQAAA